MYIIISHVCWSYFAHTHIYHVMFIWKFTMISIHVCMYIAALQVSGQDPKACATSAVRPRLRYARAIGLSVGLGGLRRGRYLLKSVYRRIVPAYIKHTPCRSGPQARTAPPPLTQIIIFSVSVKISSFRRGAVILTRRRFPKTYISRPLNRAQ